MTGPAGSAAAEAYEVRTQGMIVSILERASAVEVFRHIEDLSDDDDHLVDHIRTDLAQMTVAEFEARWVI